MISTNREALLMGLNGIPYPEVSNAYGGGILGEWSRRGVGRGVVWGGDGVGRGWCRTTGV